eukprot:224844_1
MTLLFTLILPLYFNLSSSNTTYIYNSTYGETTMNGKADSGMAIGYDYTTNTILIIGGNQYPNQFTTFNINRTTFIDKNENYSPYEILSGNANSQFYTQIKDDNILWMISNKPPYNFITMNTITYNISNTSIVTPDYIDNTACITSINHGSHKYLFVLHAKQLQVYNISSNEWLSSNISSMKRYRSSFSCIAHNQKLFAIGGNTGNNTNQSTMGDVEYLNIENMHNISSNSWILISNKIHNSRYTRANIHGDNILIFAANINVIDTSKDPPQITMAGRLLPNAIEIWSVAAIVVRNIAYIFGGYVQYENKTDRDYIDTYQYIKLPDISPTCADYMDYKSDNGTNENDFDFDLYTIASVYNVYNVNNTNNTYFITNRIALNYARKNIICGANTSCIVICNDFASCLLTSIEIDTIDNDVVIFCDDEYSCLQLVINTNSTSYMANITVICSSANACNGIQINITDFYSFNIYCMQETSCAESVINIQINQRRSTENAGIIYCVSPNSCDNMEIVTTSNLTQLVMYEYSKNIVFDNGIGYISDKHEENIICNTDRYIRYENESDFNSIVNSIFNEYQHTKLPCNDVQVKCGNNSCKMKYFMNNITTFNHLTGCYWVNVQELQNIECIGSCVLSPTFASPTNAPTRLPTINHAYDSYFKVIFGLEYLTETNVLTILDNTINCTMDITIIIEEGFVNHISWFLDYHHFWLEIIEIDGHSIEEFNGNSNKDLLLKDPQRLIELSATVQCTTQRCNYIINNYDKNELEMYVTDKLKLYFGVEEKPNDELNFIVISMSSVKSLKSSSQTEYAIVFNYIFYGLAAFGGLIILIGMSAFLFNKGLFPKLPGMNRVDDARWPALLIFALQFWDFVSDCTLSIEIWRRHDVFNELFILITAGGCTFFIIMPYIVNILIAANIKYFIKNNHATMGWFQQHTSVFTIFVAISGGCYAGLCLVSSNVFGLKIMSSGLTQYELSRLSKIKVIGTVILENIPQLLLQILYIYTIKDITNAVAIAFSASVLSVIVSTLSYLIERDVSGTKVVQYYLSTSCTERIKRNNRSHSNDNDDEIEFGFLKQLSTWNRKGELKRAKEIESVSKSHYEYDKISEQERINLINNRGRTQALGESIAEIFGITPKNIEIGYSMITKYGLITHVVHFVYESDMQTMETEIQSDMINSLLKINVSSKFFTSQLYASVKTEINQIFRDHFQLNEDFTVEHKHKLNIKSRTMTDFNDGNISRRKIILKNMISQLKITDIQQKEEKDDGYYYEDEQENKNNNNIEMGNL